MGCRSSSAEEPGGAKQEGPGADGGFAGDGFGGPKPVEESFVLLKVAGGEASRDKQEVELGQGPVNILRL